MIKKTFNWVLRKFHYAAMVTQTALSILINGRLLPKGQVLLTYLKLQFKLFFLFWLLRYKPKSESFLGYKIRFHNYGIFTFVFDEIFVEEHYAFRSEKPAPFIIDCGSNYGMSILFFKKLYPQATIIGFEPGGAVYADLKNTVAINQLSNVTVHNCAVSDQAGSLNFYYVENQLGTSINQHGSQQLTVSEVVKAVPLSDYITQEVDFLKIDIEGAEESVLHEIANKDKLKLVKELVIEYHHHLDPDNDRFSGILNLLEEQGYGYQIHTIKKPLIRSRDFQDILIYAYRKSSTP